jgi:hypothetical protein
MTRAKAASGSRTEESQRTAAVAAADCSTSTMHRDCMQHYYTPNYYTTV